jgi:hypothetical protein
MPRPAHRALALAVLLLAAPARGADLRLSPGLAGAGSGEGIFLGDGYRWARMGVVQRVLLDLVAIPANVGRWDGTDAA